MFLGNLAIMYFARYQRSSDFLKCLVKWLVVQEDPIVTELAIESVFYLADGASNLP
jgi:hypothetical protein